MLIYLKNYDFCEYVEFEAILWKIDILSITAELKFKSNLKILLHMCDICNCDYLQHNKFCFYLTDS